MAHDHEHSASPPAPLFEARGVSFRSAAQFSTPLFENLNFSIRERETVGIVGPGGSGKTWLLKLLAGLYEPNRGAILFRGRHIREYSKEQRKVFRRCVGMSFQRSGLFDSMSAAGNIAFPLSEMTGKKSAELESEVEARLAEVGLAGQGALRIQEMSGGMQKRLGIARALALEPEVALYDDPTAGLDPVTSRSIVELLESMREKHGMTVVLVTSAVHLALRFCDRLLFLHQGKIHLEATRSDFENTSDPMVRQFLEGSLEGPLTELSGFA